MRRSLTNKCFLFFIMFPTIVFASPTYKGMELRNLTTSQVPAFSRVMGLICCEDDVYRSNSSIAWDHIVELRIRMKKGAQIEIYNADKTARETYTCDGNTMKYGDCERVFTVAQTPQRLQGGLDVRAFCSQLSYPDFKIPSPFVGFTLNSGYVKVDGTGPEPITCGATVAVTKSEKTTKKSRVKGRSK